MNTILAVAAAIAGLLCLAAVFYDGFEDTLGQRVGLAIMGISLYPVAVHFYEGHDIPMGPKIALASGFAVFLLATALKTAPTQETTSSHSHVPH